MRKRFFMSTLVAVIAASTWLTSANVVMAEKAAAVEEKEYGDFKYVVLDDGTVEITSCNEDVEKVIVPEQIDGRKVTSIRSTSFLNCKCPIAHTF